MSGNVNNNLKAEPHTDCGTDAKGDSEKISMLQIFEVLLLTPVMVIVIALFLIPTVLYGLTTQKHHLHGVSKHVYNQGLIY